MPCPVQPGSAIRGEDYFRVAERMDIMGITHYIPSIGPSSYCASAIIDLAESAAAVFGKHAWIIEYNARTDLSANEWERETYAAIGGGAKGILYYQWRADFPFPGSPEPELFGMLFNDGRKSEKFERAIAMNALVKELGPLIVSAEKRRSKVAVLFSEHANAWSDAKDNRGVDEPCSERSVEYLHDAYTAFRKAGVSVDFVRACDLESNPLGTELLAVPLKAGLSAKELAQIEAFATKGGSVCFRENGMDAFSLKGSRYQMDAASVLRALGMKPFFSAPENLDVKLLDAMDASFTIACLVNIDPLERPLPAGRVLRLENASRFKEAVLRAPGRETPLGLRAAGDAMELELPEIATGAFLILR
jgi:hypothetical protein